MRILHTGDWHLGDRSGNRDRTLDIRRNVERIAEYCVDERVDVLAVAGDLFSDKLRHQDDLGDTIDHLSVTFRKFLQSGGTILAVTGNHDKEVPCLTLKNTLTLADPRDFAAGAQIVPGRLYLATGPTFYSLADRDGGAVQFVMMPYPMPSRYFDGIAAGQTTREEVNRRLQARYMAKLDEITAHASFRQDLPSVLMAHVHVQGAQAHTLYQIDIKDDVVFGDGNIPTGFAYVALGHIHRPQCLGGMEHVRYCGSIECLDLGEREDSKSVVVFDIGASKRAENIRLLPLEATPFYEVVIDTPADIANLKARYPDAERALVKYHLSWRPGEHNRQEMVRAVEAVFPNWFDAEVREVGRSVEESRHASLPAAAIGPGETVLHFLEKELERNNESEIDRDEMLAMARELMKGIA